MEINEEIQSIVNDFKGDHWIISTVPNNGIILANTDFSEVLERISDLGIDEIYIVVDESMTPIGLAFHHNGIFHLSMESEPFISSSASTESRSRLAFDSDDNIEQKREIASEIIDRYEELMSDVQVAELEGDLQYMSMSRLYRLKEKMEEKQRIDENLEKEAAKWLAEDDRFNHNCNETDSETLLEASGDFALDEIRIEEVHKKAKSYLKL
ncbi:MAG: hypothetical protein U5K70_00680 [Halodesulfurarchaeum sp.]|nr:hypothetical protein [Halodesulfurarchaeum sp.]